MFGHTLDHVAGRYAVLYELIQAPHWQTQVAGKYDYIYFPEDEIVQTVSSVNRYVMSCVTFSEIYRNISCCAKSAAVGQSGSVAVLACTESRLHLMQSSVTSFRDQQLGKSL